MLSRSDLHAPRDVGELQAQRDPHRRGDHHLGRLAADLRSHAADPARLRQPARQVGGRDRDDRQRPRPGERRPASRHLPPPSTSSVASSSSRTKYCDVECSLADADRVLAGDPTSRELLDETNIPTQFKVVPNEGTEVDTLRALKASYRDLPERLLRRARRGPDRPDRQVEGLRRALHHRSRDRRSCSRPCC